MAASTEKSRVRNDAENRCTEMTNKLKIVVPFGCYVEFECYHCCFKYFDWRSNICQIICVRMLMLFHLVGVGVLNRVGLKTFVVLRVRFRNLSLKNTSAFLRQPLIIINELT